MSMLQAHVGPIDEEVKIESYINALRIDPT